MLPEPMLLENKNRFTLFPIKYHDIWALYQKSLGNFWTAQEIDFTADLDHWNNKLNDNERFFIKNVLAFFAASDGIVNENLAINFHNEIQVPEIRCLYTSQMLIESIHNECYSLMIDTLISDADEKFTLLNAIETIPIINKKSKWALKWIGSDKSFAERLLAFAVIEGIFFSGSFCSIYWLKSRGLMPSLTLSNEFISRDEGIHCQTAIMIYNHLSNKLSEETIHDLFREAVSLEKEFIIESLPVKLIGMNSELMKQYIEFVADYWLQQIGVSPIYKVKNPFSFMDYLSLEDKTNFFEQRVSSYKRAEVSTTDFVLDEEF
ncbi:ribonucleoside-diphosphate reductase beta chain [Gammaproteobacteria bacterium]